MRLFHVVGAQYFCGSFRTSSGAAAESIKDFCATFSYSTRTIREGTSKFDEFRDCLLREVERNLFLAASNYRRSLDLMIASSASWAYVTLYYASFYAAKAFLAMFGGWIDPPRIMVEVTKAVPGTQELVIHRRHPSLEGGTHRAFWEEFYDSCNPLISWLGSDAIFLTAVKPVSDNPLWLVNNRNDINYDTYEALQLSNKFQQSFVETKFPTCLPGIMNTQYQVTEAMVVLAFSHAGRFNINTDALPLLGGSIARRVHIQTKILDAVIPNLDTKYKKAQILV